MAMTLKAARVNAGLTQAEAAAAVGVARKSIVCWEQDIESLKVGTLKKLCNLYNVELAELIL